MCLNVNGSLELKLGCKEFMESVSKFDVILCCESWTNEFSKIEIDGNERVCKHRKRKKNAKRDSGGLVCYFSKNIFKGVYCEHWDNEDGVCFKLDKDFFWLE